LLAGKIKVSLGYSIICITKMAEQYIVIFSSAEKVAVQQLEALSAELDVDKGEAARSRYYLDGVVSWCPILCAS